MRRAAEDQRDRNNNPPHALIVYSLAMARGLVFALCLFGCLKEAKFEYRDAAVPGDGIDAAIDAGNTGITCMPTTTDVSTNRSGTMDRGVNVCAPGYQMTFSDIGANMPFQLVVGGMQLLANATTCNDERGIGVGMYPVAVVNAETQSPSVVAGTVTTTLNGPVVAKVVVDWSATYTCSGPGTLQDRSTFTFFPDGHITRLDRLRQAQQTMATGCGVCSGGGGGASFFLTTYANLTAPDGSQLTGAAIGGLTNYSQSVSGLRSTCLRTNGRSVAFGWRNNSTRIRVTTTNPRTLAFVQDVSVGATLGPNFVDDVTTQMLVSQTTACADLDALARRWADRPELLVQGNSRGPSLDGIYGGENDSGETAIMTTVGNIPIQVASSTVPVPGGAAVWIEFGVQPNTGVQVLHNNVPSAPSGTWYRIQRVSASQLIFWFRDEIVDGTVITIVPGA
jgi:hypothetical protein